jgi:hypothetical protein
MIGEDVKPLNFWCGWTALSHWFGDKYGCLEGNIVQDAP